MFKLIFIDTETTGNEDKDFLCQLAFKTDDETFCALYKPPIKIPPEASAITHITNKMVADKPAFRDSTDYSRIKNLLESPTSVFVAHNAKFDIGMLAKEDIVPSQNICTLRVARYLDKENKLSMYKLQYLRYFLELEVEAQAHDALGDVLVLEKLFERLLSAVKKELSCTDQEAIAKMIEVSSQPSMMHLFNFGKHIGKKVSEVAEIDRGYLEWMLAQKMQNEANEEDWIYTLKFYLKK